MSEANPDQIHLSIDDLTANTDAEKVTDEALAQESPAVEAAMGVSQKLASPMVTFFNQAWLQNFELLKQYKEVHGNCNVPTSYTEDYTLRDWVRKQRLEYKKVSNGVHSALTQERISLLETIGFLWVNPKKKRNQEMNPYNRPPGSNTYFEERWNEMFEKLKVYKKKHGNTLVPTKYPKDKQLGNWVCAQRTNRKQFMKGGYTSPKNHARFELLDTIGFVWDVAQNAHEQHMAARRKGEKPAEPPEPEVKVSSDQQRWLQMFEKLKVYKEKHGDCLVPLKYKADQKLGQWVSSQRQRFKYRSHNENQGTRSFYKERLKMLEDIEFIFDASAESLKARESAQWSIMLDKLKIFHSKNGHVNVPDDYEEPSLAHWVKEQRVEYENYLDGAKKGTKMNGNRAELLEKLGFVVPVKEDDEEDTNKESKKKDEDEEDREAVVLDAAKSTVEKDKSSEITKKDDDDASTGPATKKLKTEEALAI
uniref:Helicase-associated domain-containing protein n=1 Tax=Leptocylindrus danicus TaxID=163516 RepID=A0A7S2JSK5_9STRA|mmetsp:Transcript_11081/g.16771  ORF Transcript_11081/g.16771 Transcript_11081/m.16771 type:complete len:478 (+) Transcript_11081:300-1733(+)|eukprot:CAMPEP_0116006248 /NCGR_PEP_ID=MMETSP0321-20121206/1620_1 /TAXON_ID=163516 /ORGANISM="Leptocylindrus danicus var. danicus, Strain B650" /LENGTH=477 /DNA_ID=CAMNT_0003474775 /DNA_START=246 /DNA_END=1679 /DNA_ORIENTATION=+